jgi:hypothetical protein
LPDQLDALRLWDDSPIPPGLRRRVLRVYAHHTFLSEQMAAIEAKRRAQLQTSSDTSIDKILSGKNTQTYLFTEIYTLPVTPHER